MASLRAMQLLMAALLAVSAHGFMAGSPLRTQATAAASRGRSDRVTGPTSGHAAGPSRVVRHMALQTEEQKAAKAKKLEAKKRMKAAAKEKKKKAREEQRELAQQNIAIQEKEMEEKRAAAGLPPSSGGSSTSSGGTAATSGPIKLYVKAGATGKALGDCPFAQAVQMALYHKGLKFDLIPCAPDAKPDWLVEEYGGSMPAMVHDGECYTESADIVEYIDYFFKDAPLAPEGTEDRIEKAMEVTQPFFGKLAKCIKNLDASTDKPLVSDVMTELEKVDKFLKEGEGPFLCGDKITMADCFFAPKLYHAKTTLAQFKNTIIPPDLEKLQAYMDAMFVTETWQKSSYPPDVVVWGWNNARGTQAK